MRVHSTVKLYKIVQNKTIKLVYTQAYTVYTKRVCMWFNDLIFKY